MVEAETSKTAINFRPLLAERNGTGITHGKYDMPPTTHPITMKTLQ
ncbi:hypothetical protein BN1007_70486 [Klebsiella variicola]|nr:hypothetical protein BN1007_70486 [Klebsiella variicola]